MVKVLPNRVYLFTDGASSPSQPDKQGGWGVLMLYNEHVRELCGAAAPTTNNAMELTAILRGLQAVTDPKARPVTVVSDSQYSIDAVTKWHKGWKKKGWRTNSGKPVKNLQIIKDILEQKKRFANLDFKWVKGHAGHEHNERADWLATEAKKRYKTLQPQDVRGRTDFIRRRQIGDI